MKFRLLVIQLKMRKAEALTLQNNLILVYHTFPIRASMISGVGESPSHINQRLLLPISRFNRYINGYKAHVVHILFSLGSTCTW